MTSRDPSLEKRNKNPDSKKYKYKTKIYKRKGILQLRKWKIKVIRKENKLWNLKGRTELIIKTKNWNLKT